MIVREREQDLPPLEAELLAQLGEHAVAHAAGHALKIARDEHGPLAGVILERECFHPQLMQLAIRRAFGAIACQPHWFFRRNDGFGDTGLPRGFGGGRARVKQGQEKHCYENGPASGHAFVHFLCWLAAGRVVNTGPGASLSPSEALVPHPLLINSGAERRATCPAIRRPPEAFSYDCFGAHLFATVSHAAVCSNFIASRSRPFGPASIPTGFFRNSTA